MKKENIGAAVKLKEKIDNLRDKIFEIKHYEPGDVTIQILNYQGKVINGLRVDALFLVKQELVTLKKELKRLEKGLDELLKEI